MKNYLIVLFLLMTQLVYSQAPTLSQISPTSATGDVVVTIVGTNFTGTTSVVLRSSVDAEVPFRVVNPTTILAMVNLSSNKYVNGRNGAIFIITNGSGSNTTGPNFDYTVKAGTCGSIVYSDWSDCKNGKQTRTFLVSPTGCTTKPPKDSTERECTVVNVRHFKYSPKDTAIEIISNVSGIIEIKNAVNEVVETYSYNAGSSEIGVSHLSGGDYTATTYDKTINLSTKFQVVIESSDFSSIVVKGRFGTAPYTYSLNSTSNYQSSLNVVISKTTHTVRCKDATGKIAVLSINNQYAGRTLKTTSNTFTKGFGGDTTGFSVDSSAIYISEEYMLELAAAANPNTSTARGGSRDRTAPTVSITAPTNNAVVSGAVSITTTATDNVGVTSVSFYIDNTLLTTDGLAPFAATWSTVGVAAGTHVIKAVAKDAANNSATASIQVSIAAPPPIADVTPPSVAFSGTWITGATVNVGTTYTLTATASDNVGVASVVFVLDGTTTIGTDVSSPYSASWNTAGLALGTHNLTARAADAAGNTTSTTIVINALAATPSYSVSFTRPTTTDTSVIAGQAVTVSANVTASAGVKTVTFRRLTSGGITTIAVDSVSPYSITFNTTGLGGATSGSFILHQVFVEITDSSNNTFSSSSNANYRNVKVYNTNFGTTTYPAVFNLITPPVGDQGSEGSCVPFGAGYGARSVDYYYRNNMTSYSYSTNIFSPEFLYNRLKLRGNSGGCADGSSLLDCFNLMRDTGACRWALMPYTSGSCTTPTTPTQDADALNYKILGNTRILTSDSLNMKSLLYNSKKAIVISISVDNSFMAAGPDFVWRVKLAAGPGHVIFISGFDDTKHAWKVQNSWGTGWGNAGYTWIDYDLLPQVAFFYSYYIN